VGVEAGVGIGIEAGDKNEAKQKKKLQTNW